METNSQTTLPPSFDKTTPAVDGSPSAVQADPLAEAPQAPTAGGFRLRRSRENRMLGGVCGGLAESLNVDVTLLRIALVAVTVLGGGIGALVYVAAWIVAPEADAA